MKNGLIYTRVSTQEQAKEGQSIDAQIKISNTYAKENKIAIVDIYKDGGKSGSNTNRAGLQDMLARITNDKAIDCVLVMDTDRLARNTLDHLSIKALLKKHDVQLISISQPMIDDSPEGRFIDTVLAGANALQSQITGRKTSKVMEEKARAGWWPGMAPIGYKNTINPTPSSNLDKKIVTPHPQTGPIVTQKIRRATAGSARRTHPDRGRAGEPFGAGRAERRVVASGGRVDRLRHHGTRAERLGHPGRFRVERYRQLVRADGRAAGRQGWQRVARQSGVDRQPQLLLAERWPVGGRDRPGRDDHRGHT